MTTDERPSTTKPLLVVAGFIFGFFVGAIAAWTHPLGLKRGPGRIEVLGVRSKTLAPRGQKVVH